jgi:hypothetical protein
MIEAIQTSPRFQVCVSDSNSNPTHYPTPVPFPLKTLNGAPDSGCANPLPLPPLRRALALLAALMLAILGLSACGNTLQDQPISRSALEPMVLNSRYPVYWLGEAFNRYAIIEAAHDPSDAYTIHYGDCLEGGQYTCVTPLTIVTSPDNSFIPGGAAARHTVLLRGVRARVSQGGTTIALATGPVVVSIFAHTAALAHAAALTMVPINEIGVPATPLPPALPNTHFASEPLASQKPVAVHIPSALEAPHNGVSIP